MYYIFNDENEFNTWHSQINTLFGYPDLVKKTDKYTTGYKHLEDDRYYCEVNDSVPLALQKDSYSEEYMIKNNFKASNENN